MWMLLCLIPPFATMVWAMHTIKGIKATQRRVQLLMIGLIGVCYFCIQYLVVRTGMYPFYGAKILHDLAATLLVPLIHLFYCYSLGIEHELRFFRLMIALSLLLVPELMMFFSVSGEHQALPIDACFSYLNLNFGNGYEWRLQLYGVIVLLQVAIEMQRIFVLRRIFIVRELYLTREGKAVVWGSIIVCAWIGLTLLPSHTMLQHYHGNEVMIVIYSLLAAALMHLVVRYLSSDIIIDGDKNPVNIAADTDAAIADSIRVAIARDKVFLNNSLRIEDFAEALSTNRTYVARVCRLRYRMTFTELMNHHRVEYAKQLMVQNPRKRMDEVAADSGFSSASFFARVFKAHEGVSPTQWRQANVGALV